MFKKFVQRIVESAGREDAIQNVFYGTKFDEAGNVIQYGIDIAYQHEKITWKEHELLLALIEKLA